MCVRGLHGLSDELLKIIREVSKCFGGIFTKLQNFNGFRGSQWVQKRSRKIWELFQRFSRESQETLLISERFFRYQGVSQAFP